jgi:hypothetical protein
MDAAVVEPCIEEVISSSRRKLLDEKIKVQPAHPFSVLWIDPI